MVNTFPGLVRGVGVLVSSERHRVHSRRVSWAIGFRQSWRTRGMPGRIRTSRWALPGNVMAFCWKYGFGTANLLNFWCKPPGLLPAGSLLGAIVGLPGFESSGLGAFLLANPAALTAYTTH